MAAWKDATRNGALEVDHRLWNAEQGIYRNVQMRGRPVIDDADRVVEWFGTATDVHEMLLLQERQQVLLHELQHRVRNTLAIIRSIARRTGETSASVEEYAEHLEGRINSLSRTQTLLTRAAESRVELIELIRGELAAYVSKNSPQVTLHGPKVWLTGRVAENLSLVIHELTTNAVKYGALSVAEGDLNVEWEVATGEAPLLKLFWRENGLPHEVKPPSRRGFGSDLIENLVPYQLGGTGLMQFEPEGLTCIVSLPLSDLIGV